MRMGVTLILTPIIANCVCTTSIVESRNLRLVGMCEQGPGSSKRLLARARKDRMAWPPCSAFLTSSCVALLESCAALLGLERRVACAEQTQEARVVFELRGLCRGAGSNGSGNSPRNGALPLFFSFKNSRYIPDSVPVVTIVNIRSTPMRIALGVTLILTPIIANCVSARHCRESFRLVGMCEQGPGSLRLLCTRARKDRMAWPPCSPHRIPDLFMRCVARVLHAASVTPEPIGRPCSLSAA